MKYLKLQALCLNLVIHESNKNFIMELSLIKIEYFLSGYHWVKAFIGGANP